VASFAVASFAVASPAVAWVGQRVLVVDGGAVAAISSSCSPSCAGRSSSSVGRLHFFLLRLLLWRLLLWRRLRQHHRVQQGRTEVVPPPIRPFEPRIRGVGGGWAVRQAEPLRGSPWPSACLSLHPGGHTNRSHRRVLCAVARHHERRTCSTRPALHYFINVFADRHPAFLPIDARPPHDHHPVSGEEPRMRGRPGCMRACPPCRQRRQLRCLRESSLRQW
jgi:hypothetical protein